MYVCCRGTQCLLAGLLLCCGVSCLVACLLSGLPGLRCNAAGAKHAAGGHSPLPLLEFIEEGILLIRQRLDLTPQVGRLPIGNIVLLLKVQNVALPIP